MDGNAMERRRYPVGRYVMAEAFDKAQVAKGIEYIGGFPERLRKVVAGLSEADLAKRYKPGGWSARQVIHHMGDSHVNAYIRFKWALTEDKPLIKAYFEERWAELADSRAGSVEPALGLIEGVHGRWAALLRTLGEMDLRKSYFHPETGKEWHLYDTLAMYSWHSRHHLAHIELCLTDPASDA